VIVGGIARRRRSTPQRSGQRRPPSSAASASSRSPLTARTAWYHRMSAAIPSSLPRRAFCSAPALHDYERAEANLYSPL